MARHAASDTIKAEMVQHAVTLWEEVQNQFEWMSSSSSNDSSMNYHMTQTNQTDDDPTTKPCYPTRQSINLIAMAFAKVGELDHAEVIMRQLCAEVTAWHHRQRQRRPSAKTTVQQQQHSFNRPSDDPLVPYPRCLTAILSALSR